MKAYLIVAGVSLVVGLTVGAGVGYDQADTKRKAEVAELKSAHVKEKEAALEKSRKWYRDAMSEQQKAMEKLQNDLNNIETDKRRADAARDGLLSEYRRLVTGLSANNCDPSLVADGKPAACAGSLPADLFEELDTMAGEFAAQADTAMARGLGCEKAYKSLENGRNKKAP